MSYLTLSEFPEISRYRADGSLRDDDYIEISLYRGGVTPTSIGNYVSSRVPIKDLKSYLNTQINVQTNLIADVGLFDITNRISTSPPILANIFHDGEFVGNIYSHWPLFIDPSGKSPDWNSTAPNWICQNHIPTLHKTIEDIYPDFWDMLATYAASGYIKYDSVDATDSNSISASTYMSEYNQLGYTCRILIDETNKFVALPILNGSFMGCPTLSSGILSSSPDSITNHTHVLNVNIQNATATSAQNCTLEINSTLNKATLSAFATDIASDNTSDFSDSTHPKYIDVLPFMCIANNVEQTTLCGDYTPLVEDDLPVGTILSFANQTVPPGWFTCDGRTLSANAYPELASALGVTDYNSTFQIPDIIDRFITHDLESQSTSTVDNANTLLTHHHGMGDYIHFIVRPWNISTPISVSWHNLYCDVNTTATITTGGLHTIYPQYETNSGTPVIQNMINYCTLLPCIKARNV